MIFWRFLLFFSIFLAFFVTFWLHGLTIEDAIKALKQPKHELDIVVARETNSNVDPQLFTVDVGGSPQRCYFWFCICISFILPAFYRRLVKETDANCTLQKPT